MTQIESQLAEGQLGSEFRGPARARRGRTGMSHCRSTVPAVVVPLCYRNTGVPHIARRVHHHPVLLPPSRRRSSTGHRSRKHRRLTRRHRRRHYHPVRHSWQPGTHAIHRREVRGSAPAAIRATAACRTSARAGRPVRYHPTRGSALAGAPSRPACRPGAAVRVPSAGGAACHIEACAGHAQPHCSDGGASGA